MRCKVTAKLIIIILLSIILIQLMNNSSKQIKNALFASTRYVGRKRPVIKYMQQKKYSGLFTKTRAEKKSKSMKYILLWTAQENIPFINMGIGQAGFISRQCPYTNCIVSGNESLLGSTTEFDAIIFAGPELIQYDDTMLPARRLPKQKFVFASIESPENYPLCAYNFDGYFNWTWTYKLDSDVRWGYITIRNTDNEIVGPKKEMHWINWFDMKPVSESFKETLKTKTRAVAWFVSNCVSRSHRESFVKNLEKQLLIYNLEIDVYGTCGSYICSRDEKSKCDTLIKNDYYFYLSFENAFSEDYVTEKLLHALLNNAVPIVYGGANYSRFLPDGSYLNARELGIHRLAKEIHDLINDPERYANFFRWKNHYWYHRTIDTIETNEYCNMCAALNNEESMKTVSVYTEFSDFWEVYKTC